MTVTPGPGVIFRARRVLGWQREQPSQERRRPYCRGSGVGRQSDRHRRPCVDEKLPIQALDRTAPVLSMRIGSLGRPPTTTPDTAPPPCSPLGYRHRQGHRAAQTAPSPSGVPHRPQTPHPRLPGARAASGDGQRRHPQEGPKSGRGGPTVLVFMCIPRPRRIVDEPCGGVVRNNRTAGHPPRTFGSIKELTTKIRAFID